MRSTEKRRNKAKNPREEIKVTIKTVSDREGEYVAYHASEFLNATYSVYFRNTIFGAIAPGAVAGYTRALARHLHELIAHAAEAEPLGVLDLNEPVKLGPGDGLDAGPVPLFEEIAGSHLHGHEVAPRDDADVGRENPPPFLAVAVLGDVHHEIEVEEVAARRLDHTGRVLGHHLLEGHALPVLVERYRLVDADGDALPAADAERPVDVGFSIDHGDGVLGAPLEAGAAGGALVAPDCGGHD